ncbi:uncharacterized protein LOC125195387 [Salvia hispanica]|uniref:uncharacterized protein LOC125195387 n=1 Tax=Salvia hispanica TaxID=49212 RepID=UPI0020092CE8|nr:uncharacterized protein LOC125195387 [Salvia hispanica]
MYNNFNKRFLGEKLRNTLWGIAGSTTVEQYERRMEALKVKNVAAYNYLVAAAPKEKWVTAFFSEHARCDSLLNNMCETFNSKIVEAREMAIITMLEELRTKQMQRIQYRGKWIQTYDYPVPPVIKEYIEKESKHAGSWRAIFNGDDSYQVSGPGGQFVVNLRHKSCTCRRWQIRGIPCVHAVSCILKIDREITDYVSPYYKIDSMVLLYRNVLYPINGVDNWSKSSEVGFDLEPPRSKRQRGRPKKNRSEKTVIMVRYDGVECLQRQMSAKCGWCGVIGHNRRTCSNDPMNTSTSSSNVRPHEHNQNECQSQAPPAAAQGESSSHRQGQMRQEVPITYRKRRSTAQRCGRRGNDD